MRISDWSSDVCSSDLLVHAPAVGLVAKHAEHEDRDGKARALERVLLDHIAPPVEATELAGHPAGLGVGRGLAGAVIDFFFRPHCIPLWLMASAAAHGMLAVVVVQHAQRQPRRVAGQLVHSADGVVEGGGDRSEEHTSELQSLMRISYAVFCLTKKI